MTITHIGLLRQGVRHQVPWAPVVYHCSTALLVLALGGGDVGVGVPPGVGWAGDAVVAHWRRLDVISDVAVLSAGKA